MAKCPICDFEDVCIVDHLKEDHGYSIPDFREKYGYDFLLADSCIYELIEEDLKEKEIFREGDLTSKNYFILEGIKLEKLDDLSSRPFVPTIDPHYHFAPYSKWVAIAIKEKKNLFLTGLPGTGKSSIVLQTYARLNRSLYHVSSFGDLTYEHLIYKDELRTNTETGNVETAPQYGAIIQSMKDEKNKAGLLFDEISFADPRVLQVLQPLLESSTRYLTIPETGEIIRAHDDWIFFATDNTRGQGDELGMFSGTENMNFALLNRFPIFLELDYLDPKSEQKVLQNKLEDQGVYLKKNFYQKIMKVTKVLRNGIKNEKYYMTFSLRDLYEWLVKLKYMDTTYDSFIEAAKVTFVNKLDKITQQGILNVLEDILG